MSKREKCPDCEKSWVKRPSSNGYWQHRQYCSARTVADKAHTRAVIAEAK